MTVEELIVSLNEIENKNTKVAVSSMDNERFHINIDTDGDYKKEHIFITSI